MSEKGEVAHFTEALEELINVYDDLTYAEMLGAIEVVKACLHAEIITQMEAGKHKGRLN